MKYFVATYEKPCEHYCEFEEFDSLEYAEKYLIELNTDGNINDYEEYHILVVSRVLKYDYPTTARKTFVEVSE